MAAVVRMMKYITKLEKNMPVSTSVRARRNSSSVAPWRFATVFLPSARSSSTSCAACQKKRYGEMLVPRIPTSTDRYSLDHWISGTNVARSTAAQSGWARNAVIT